MTARLRSVGVAAAAVLSAATVALAQGTQSGSGAALPEGGIKPPSPVQRVDPKYTSDAMRRHVEGDVHLQIVVLKDGTVGNVRVVHGIDSGLDAEAIKAARQWRFNPGLDASDQPVPVIVTLVLSFRLHDTFATNTCFAPSANVTAPTVTNQVQPEYTRDARAANIEGEVTVEAVVDPNGKVARARVINSLDSKHGLDDQAIRAVKQWKFMPNSGTCEGRPFPIRIRLVLTFSLQ